MATGNEKITAIKRLNDIGLVVSIKKVKETEITMITVLKDGQELGYIMDKTLGTGSEQKIVCGSAYNIFVKKVNEGWPQNEEGE